MRILSIETSCDDTSIAIVEAMPSGRQATGGKTAPRFKVLANIVSSQTAIHRHWGGVVPNLAKREHIRNLPLIWRRIVRSRKTEVRDARIRPPVTGHPSPDKQSDPSSIDLIAVTVGPGLEPSLWTGIEFAKKLSAKLKIPLVGANHLEGHLYSFLLPQNVGGRKTEDRSAHPRSSEAIGQAKRSDIRHPTIALLVSGGHTMLLLMKDLLHWKLLGETRDDAVGEAFDKVARMMDLPYPGGPEIERLALRQAQGKPEATRGTINFPRPMLREANYDFSFSGLKTAVLYYVRSQKTEVEGARHRSPVIGHRTNEAIGHPSSDKQSDPSSVISDIAASFQSAAIDVLCAKTIRAVREFGAQSVILCGGVAANMALREALQRAATIAGATFIAPAKEYNTDNAAMIAAAAYMRTLRKQKGKKAKKQNELPLEANGNLGL